MRPSGLMTKESRNLENSNCLHSKQRAALWVLIIDPPQSKKLLVQIPDCPLTWNLCIWKLGSKICREPRQKVFGTPPPVELHCKKGSLRLTELRPWRHLCSGITILGKRIQHRAWKTTKQFGKNSSHVLAHLLVVREGLGVLLVFPRVSYGFLTANSNICHGIFDKRKFFFKNPV